MLRLNKYMRCFQTHSQSQIMFSFEEYGFIGLVEKRSIIFRNEKSERKLRGCMLLFGNIYIKNVYQLDMRSTIKMKTLSTIIRLIWKNFPDWRTVKLSILKLRKLGSIWGECGI